jgi:hypothetical protein
MFQLSFRIATVVLSTVVASTTPAAAQGNLRGGPAAAPAPRAAPAPQMSAPRAAPAPQMSAPRAAPQISAPRAAPQISAPRAAPQMPRAAPQTPRAAPQQLARPPQGPSPAATSRQAPTPKTLAAPTQPKQQGGETVGRAPGRDGNLARQQQQGADPSARVGGNLTPQNQPGQRFQLSGDDQRAGNRVLRNQLLADRAAAGGVRGNALARTTFAGSFADKPWRRHFRRHHFPIVIGWVGPLFWPYAYSDFVSYTFYPYAYDTFWPYAYDDIYDGMFGRYAYRGGDAYAAVGRGGGGGGRPPASRSVGADLCSGQTAGLTDWPIEQIAQAVQPDDSQRATLDELKAATATALDILKASCPTELPSTPTGRIEAMHKRLAAMLQAVQTVRPPLEKFYLALNDEQKARFNALGSDESQQQTRRDLAQVCGERAAGIAGLPTDRIERAVRPDAAQRGALKELQDATAQAVELLKADCPTYRALTPVGRLQAMEQRLDAMLRAVQTVQPALERFYGALSDEQKERFNRLAPAQG